MSHIKIRPQQIKDAKRFFEILTNPNFIFFGANPKSIEDEKKFLRLNAKKRKKNIEHNFTILLGKKIVGGCGIKINQDRKYIGEIGYFIDEEYWGKGFATQAAKLLEKIGFGKLNLSRIEILMVVKNKGSEKVAIKSGYKKEGRMRKALKDKKGKMWDCYLYAKIN